MNNSEYRTQTEAVLNHMRTNGSITSLEAIDCYGATRLSAIIYYLRQKGYNIKSTRCSVNNMSGRNVSVSVYSLE